MRTIIHDLKEENLSKFSFDSDDKIINANRCTNSCIGCFSCWTKHPKHCIYKDEYSNIANSLKKSDEFVLISECRYGCYSHELKRVLERTIGYVLPYFMIRSGRIHHKCRYKKKLKLKVYLYGDVNDIDKTVIDELVKANGINFNVDSYEIIYIDLGEVEHVYIN